MSELGRTPNAMDIYRERIEANDAEFDRIAEDQKTRLADIRTKLAALAAARRPEGFDLSVKTAEDYYDSQEAKFNVGDPYPITQEEYDLTQRIMEDPLGSKAGAFASGLRTGAGILESVFDVGHRALIASAEDETWESAGELIRAREEEIARGDDAISQFLGIDEMIKFYNMRPEVQQRYAGWNLAGQVTAAVLDPTSLMPLAPFIKSGAPLSKALMVGGATGAGIAGIDSLALQAARTDDIDTAHVGAAAVLGAAVAPILILGGKTANGVLNSLFGKQKATGDVTETDAIEGLREVVQNQNEANVGLRSTFENRNPLEEQAAHNSSLRQLFNLDEAAAIDASGIGASSRLTEAVHRTANARREAASKFPQVGLANAVKRATDIKNEMTQAILQGDAVKAARLLMPAIKAQTPVAREAVDAAQSIDQLAISATDLETRRLAEQLWGVRVPEGTAKAGAVDPKPAWKRKTNKGYRQRREGAYAYELIDDTIGYRIKRKMQGKKSEWNLFKKKGKKWQNVGQHRTLDDAKRAADAEINKTDAAPAKLTKPDESESSAKLKEAVSKEAKEQGLKYQRGFTDLQMSATLFGGAAGGIATGDITGAAMGAGFGMASPALLRMFTQTVGKGVDELSPQEIDTVMTTANYGSKPMAAVRHTLGETGEEIWERLTRAATAQDRLQADLLRTAKKTEESLGKRFSVAEKTVAKREAADILRKTLDSSLASPLARAFAKDYKEMFGAALRAALDAGVIDRKKYTALSQWANKEGYFPRVYDEVFLHSKEGEQLFLDRMMDFTSTGRATENDIKLMLSHILNDKPSEIKILKMLPMVNGKVDPRLARHEDFAKTILSRMQNRSVGTTDSKHLEKSRLLNNSLEELLTPFLVKDPEDALSHYIIDVGRRVAHAKEFGADYGDFQKLSNTVFQRYGERPQKLINEIFWDRTGNPKSSNIQASIEQGQGAKRVLGQIDAYTTWKLSMAQMLNMGQAPINSSILAARMTGGNLGRAILKPISDLTKQVKTPEFQRIADQSAAAIETNLMQMVGEHTNIHNRVFGKAMEGPLDLINNPSKFLKATGFISVEQFNRKLAANWGVITAKDLLRESAELQAQGKALPKRLQTAFQDLGLPKNATAATEDELLTAGLRFSDMVNFRQRPGELPMKLTHPNAKLFMKFKSFAFNHASFLHENLVRPIFEDNRRGAAGAAASLALLATALGVPISGLRSLIRGDDEDWTMTQRWLHAFSATGGAGIFWDILRSKSGISSQLAGPFLGDVDTAQRELRQMFSGNQSPSQMVIDFVTGTQVIPFEQDVKNFLSRNLGDG